MNTSNLLTQPPGKIITKPVKGRRAKVNYVNNKDFLAAMVEFKSQVAAAKARQDNSPPEEINYPRVSKYIGECIFQIANRLASKPNFYNYPFKEEMIGDGIENCLQYINNFNPEKSNNPFAYFTQIIFCAYLRRIDKEKKQLYIKYKAAEHMEIFNLVSDRQVSDVGGSYDDGIKSSDGANSYRDDFIESFEAKKKRKT